MTDGQTQSQAFAEKYTIMYLEHYPIIHTRLLTEGYW